MLLLPSQARSDRRPRHSHDQLHKGPRYGDMEPRASSQGTKVVMLLPGGRASGSCQMRPHSIGTPPEARFSDPNIAHIRTIVETGIRPAILTAGKKCRS